VLAIRVVPRIVWSAPRAVLRIFEVIAFVGRSTVEWCFADEVNEPTDDAPNDDPQRNAVAIGRHGRQKRDQHDPQKPSHELPMILHGRLSRVRCRKSKGAIGVPSVCSVQRKLGSGERWWAESDAKFAGAALPEAKTDASPIARIRPVVTQMSP
jgi:hypothetical protein